MRLGLDIGYGYTKIATSTGKIITFPTLARKGEKAELDSLLSAYEDYVVSVNGDVWYIGQMALKEGSLLRRAFGEAERFNSDAYQAILATALAVVSADNDEGVTLVTGLPLTQYKKNKKNFQQFLENYNAYVEIKDNVKQIKIDRSLVFPQSAGVLFSPDFSSIAENLEPGIKVVVLDIGYRTTDVATFINEKNKFRFKIEESFSIDEGMSTVFSKLRKDIAERQNDLSTTLEKAEKYFNKYLQGDKEYADCIMKHKENLATSIYEKVSVDIKDINNKEETVVVLAGGGSIALKEELKQLFPNTVYTNNTQMANALGFLKVAELLDII